MCVSASADSNSKVTIMKWLNQVWMNTAASPRTWALGITMLLG
jgi:hypothetical protein